jgi:hypothetical protein
MDARDELEPEDILRRAVEAGRSLTAIRIATSSAHYQDGELEEEAWLEIRVADDSYKRNLRTGDEQLAYRGDRYARETDRASWRRLASVGFTLESASVDPWLASEVFGFAFSESQEFKRLPDETVDGRTLIHLATESTHTIPSLDTDTLREKMASIAPGRLPVGFDDQLQAQLSRIPDRFSGTAHIWVSSEDFFVHRLEEKGTLYRASEEVGWFRKTTEFSDFNWPLELPGPLPEP